MIMIIVYFYIYFNNNNNNNTILRYNNKLINYTLHRFFRLLLKC